MKEGQIPQDDVLASSSGALNQVLEKVLFGEEEAVEPRAAYEQAQTRRGSEDKIHKKDKNAVQKPRPAGPDLSETRPLAPSGSRNLKQQQGVVELVNDIEQGNALARANAQGSSYPGAYAVSPSRLSTTSTSSGGQESNRLSPALTTNNEDTMVCATVVQDEDIENEVRDRILQEAVQAQVQEEDKKAPPSPNRTKVVLACLLIVAGVAVAVGAVLGTKDKKNQDSSNTLASPPPTPSATNYSHLTALELVRERDAVTCGAYLPSPGLVAWNDATQRMEGLLADMCRAIAAVVLGDPTKVRFVSVGPFDRFPLLHNRTIDVVAEPATHTMQRDVRETNLQTGLSFSAPFYYSGLGFAGKQFAIECMDDFDVSTGSCRDVQLCVTAHTTHLDIVREHVPAALAIVKESAGECIQKFLQGEANVVSGEPISLNEKRFREVGYNDTIYFTHNVLSREPLSMVTLDEDTEWSDVVNSVVDLLYTAEALNLTQGDARQAIEAGELPPSLVTSDLLANRMLQVVGVAGHYGEIYEANLQDQLPRGGLNQLHNSKNKSPTLSDAATGLLYSFPFGYNLDKLDPSIQPGPKIAAIQERGYLRCGVRGNRPGFALRSTTNGTTTTWQGLDVELCKAVAAALFRTEEGHLEMVPVMSPGFESLMGGDDAQDTSTIDVLTGAPLTLTTKYNEPTTGGRSFGFSLPYFYYGEDEKVLGLATHRQDTKFIDLLYWLVMALVYAEEEQITATNATLMPIINLFGDPLKQMLIDCVSRLGNYGDIYQRTVQNSIPRMGTRNELNDLEAGLGPQQFGIPLV